MIRDLVAAARAGCALALLRVAARVAGSPPEQAPLPTPDDDPRYPGGPVTPAARAMIAEPEPRRAPAQPAEPLAGTLAAQLQRR